MASDSMTRGGDATFRNVMCCFYTFGIIGSLVCYGVLQERIMTVDYENQIFSWPLFLVFCNRLAAVIFSVCMAIGTRESLSTQVPMWKYVVVSLTNVAATTCQYDALKYVIFPVQMLAKSFKMMPVMAWGRVVSSKTYTTADWTIAAFVSFGVLEFLVMGPTRAHPSRGSTLHGYALLLMFLVFDGLTSTLQECLFKEHSVSKYNQMMYINSVSSLVSIALLMWSGGLRPALNFGHEHTMFVIDATLLSASAVMGQWFIYEQVKDFGALVFAATMNVRQVVSILVSNAHFGHKLTKMQGVGLGIVFCALLAKPTKEFLGTLRPAGESEPIAQKDGKRGKKAVDDGP